NTGGANKVVVIRTVGATFPKYQIEKWIKDYQKVNPNVKIEYQGGGSGYGQEAFLKGLAQIGRTDPPVNKEMWDKFLATGDQPLQFPEIVGAVVVSYNIPEIKDKTLNLTPDVLAEIFMGKIKYWDDPKIKELNPGLNLPHKEIITIHRSDASGTTAIFTTYLSVASNVWPKNKVGKLWPFPGGLAGKGNPGVVAILEKTPYSIAYTELSYAIENNLPVAALKNKAGKFVKPTDETIKAAVAEVKANIPDPTEGYKENLTQLLNAPGENSYPIVAFTHFLIWENKNGKHYSPEEAKAVKDFVRWVLTEGQKPEHLAPGYVGLPESVAKIGLKAVDMVKE
ncbi:phosphate ABC transporter substrate-binding protein PstS, partial [Methanocaldococcus sp.]